MHSPKPRSGSRPQNTQNTKDYRHVFVKHVRQLIQLGYERLNPADYSKTQEPAITGELCTKIDEVLNCDKEDWMHFYSVYDDPPENDDVRKGKQRKRVDLRFDSSQTQPRGRFRFEAKRLGRDHTAKVYLVAEGLGCFLRGDYAKDEDHAGMLGYVQSEELQTWGDKIAKILNDSPSDFQVDSSLPFQSQSKPKNFPHALYQSKHTRPAIGRNLLIDHILMRFH